MLSVDDIKKLTEVFATKQDLERLEERVEGAEHRTTNLLDRLYGELKDFRQEQQAHRQEHDDINVRLDRIESVPVIAHELKQRPS